MGQVSQLEDETDRRAEGESCRGLPLPRFDIKDLPDAPLGKPGMSLDEASEAFAKSLERLQRHNAAAPSKPGKLVKHAIEGSRLCDEVRIALKNLATALPTGRHKDICMQGLKTLNRRSRM